LLAILVSAVQERGVVSCGVIVLFSCVCLVHLRVGVRTIANTENVINIDISNECLKLGKQIQANISCVHCLTTIVAVICNHLVTNFLAVKGVPVGHFNISRCAIVGVVRNTISHSETFEVWLENIWVVDICRVILINIV